jgi:hypothetical protein
VIGFLEPFVARLLGTDGTWEIGPDGGKVFTAEDAVRLALARAVESDPDATLVTIARQSAASFDRVTVALGPLHAPEAPVTHWWDPALSALESVAPDMAKHRIEARPGHP